MSHQTVILAKGVIALMMASPTLVSGGADRSDAAVDAKGLLASL